MCRSSERDPIASIFSVCPINVLKAVKLPPCACTCSKNNSFTDPRRSRVSSSCRVSLSFRLLSTSAQARALMSIHNARCASHRVTAVSNSRRTRQTRSRLSIRPSAEDGNTRLFVNTMLEVMPSALAVRKSNRFARCALCKLKPILPARPTRKSNTACVFGVASFLASRLAAASWNVAHHLLRPTSLD